MTKTKHQITLHKGGTAEKTVDLQTPTELNGQLLAAQEQRDELRAALARIYEHFSECNGTVSAYEGGRVAEILQGKNKDCEHPSDQVTHDIAQGDWKGHSIQWCRICGAFRVSVHDGESVDPVRYTSPWREAKALSRCAAPEAKAETPKGRWDV